MHFWLSKIDVSVSFLELEINLLNLSGASKNVSKEIMSLFFNYSNIFLFIEGLSSNLKYLLCGEF